MTAMSSRLADSAAHKRTLEVLPGGGARFQGCSSIRNYHVQEKLGEGTFGEVYKGRSQKTSAVVAMKKILVHNEKDGFPITALREIRLLKELSHVNVLRLEEMVIERKKEGKKRATMYMVTPYMEHDLSGLLENPQVRFTVPQIKCYMLQLLRGLQYLHENQILHRDMKAANLLINNKGILQIADFGLARHFDEMPPQPGKGNGEALRDYTGLVVTRWYRPPELLLQLRRYTPAIDMWGVGCVFGEMFTRKPILAGNSEVNQIQLIFDLVGSPTEENMPGWSSLPGCEGVKEFKPRPSTLAQRFRDQGSAFVSLMSELLRLDWRKRINAIDALNHPYFHMEPFPARPDDIPQFEDSHELDRRKFRGQMAALPPAPAGGTVGMGAGGDWPNGAAAHNRGGWESNGMNGYGSGSRNGYQHHNRPHHPHTHSSASHEQRWDRARSGGVRGGNSISRDYGAPRNGYDGVNSANARQPGYGSGGGGGGGGGGGVHAHPERQSTGIRDYPPHPSLPPRPDWATADGGGGGSNSNGGRARMPPRSLPRDRGSDKYVPSYSGHRPQSSGSNGGGGWNGPQRSRANNYSNSNNHNNDNNGRRRGSSGSDWEREGDPDPKVERDRRQRSRSRSRSPLRRSDRERDLEKMRERERELYRR